MFRNITEASDYFTKLYIKYILSNFYVKYDSLRLKNIENVSQSCC
jgi:hypothetical protein